MLSPPGLQLRVNSVWLASLAAWGDLTYSFCLPGGCKEASWTTRANYGSRVPVLVGGAFVEILWGGWLIWSGTLTEPDWNGSDVSCTANGLFRLGEDFDNLDGAGTNTTDNATTATTAAIARGLRWSLSTSVPNVTLDAGATDPVLSLTAVLDGNAEKLGQNWWVDQFGVLQFAASPSTPSYAVRAGAADLGIARDNYASNVVLRYNSSATATYALAVYPPFVSPSAYELKYGHKEWTKDITDRTAISAATAAALAQTVYTQSYARPGWSNGIAPAHGELLTPNGQVVHPASVDAFNRSVRVHGVQDEITFLPFVDFTIASTSHKEGEETVGIDPFGLAARDPEAVLTEQLEALGVASA